MKYRNIVIYWLLLGLFMVFIQVIVGGITRLTESGLSITKWEVVSGTVPPLTEAAWEREFDLYKDTPQYAEINEGMSMSDFKFIYFWEFIHRFWARVMGFVFLIPFIVFYLNGWIDKRLIKKLALVVLLAIIAATFGWIMVASGLVQRPWVNAYKLSLHLLIAFAVYGALFWAYLFAADIQLRVLPSNHNILKRNLIVFTVLLVVQLFLGGVMSGMKAAVIHPTWPDMSGSYLPGIIFDLSQWNVDNFNKYDSNPFVPTLIHFLHRNIAYILFIVGIIFSYKLFRSAKGIESRLFSNTAIVMAIILSLQVLLGIVTVITSIGAIPVLWGVMHQAFALLLLTSVIFLFFIFSSRK